MAAPVHRVGRQSWQVNAGSEREALAVRMHLRAQLEDELPKVLERAFDLAVPGDSVLHIPKLELRLCVAAIDQLPATLAQAIAQELGKGGICAPLINAQANRIEVLTRYLESGALPWHAAHEEANAAAVQLQATLLAELDEMLRRVPSGTSHMRALEYFFRLLELVPEHRRSEVATRMAGARAAEAAAAIANTQAGPSGRHAALLCAAAVLAAAHGSELIDDRRPPALEPVKEETLPVMARHAGLVLLHPFLATLFEATGLYTPKDGLRPQLGRAAALLHWLATGREEIHEFELGIVKVLLGLRPENTLPVSSGLLHTSDREEGIALLQTMLEHWKTLKRTSVEGLRLSFLQRRGVLRDTEAGWRLQIESEPFDMLLERLPWGFTTVRLPWMTRPLFTDWPKP